MSTNPDAVANLDGDGGSGEFKPRIAPDESMTKQGHQPGVLVGNDRVPEFEAQTLPAGSAPPERTFQPNPTGEIPPLANRMEIDEVDVNAEQTTAEDTIPGATSADVHTGLGHPGSGQTSAEIRHDGEKGRKNPGRSLEGVGAATREFKTVDERDPKFKDHRAIDEEERVLGRGEILSAEEREAVSAEQLAAERSQRERQDRGN